MGINNIMNVFSCDWWTANLSTPLDNMGFFFTFIHFTFLVPPSFISLSPFSFSSFSYFFLFLILLHLLILIRLFLLCYLAPFSFSFLLYTPPPSLPFLYLRFSIWMFSSSSFSIPVFISNCFIIYHFLGRIGRKWWGFSSITAQT